MTIDNKLKSKCPVCVIPLITGENNSISQECSKCRRVYYPISSDIDYYSDNNDIETLTSSDDFYNDGLVLLSENTVKPKPDSYLRKHFGNHVTIETELIIPE